MPVSRLPLSRSDESLGFLRDVSSGLGASLYLALELDQAALSLKEYPTFMTTGQLFELPLSEAKASCERVIGLVRRADQLFPSLNEEPSGVDHFTLGQHPNPRLGITEVRSGPLHRDVLRRGAANNASVYLLTEERL
ncbi:MAG: hypothetical protein VYD19_11225 [Myxococcota bacterium]|nr:hypothetical protein [Myxococcota bacterium]